MTMSLEVTLGSEATSAETNMLRLFAVNGMILAPSIRSTACEHHVKAIEIEIHTRIEQQYSGPVAPEI